MQGLAVKPGGIYVDGTLGGGGHAEQVLMRCAPNGRLYGIDRDDDALAAAGRRLAVFGERFTAVKGNFMDAPELLGHIQPDGILLDLGVSSYQLDEPERGFSYMQDGPLDMRMDANAPFSAYDVINGYSQQELCSVIQRYGEERWANAIARAIVTARSRQPITRTGQLSDIIISAIPAKARRTGPHPAKRTFQAVRIEVNGELEHLEQTVENLAQWLAPGGRLCIITFHSLEDRAVKQAMRRMERPCTCPKSAPICICGKQPVGVMRPGKPVLPDEQEVMNNPRARSAKLRIFEKYESGGTQ